MTNNNAVERYFVVFYWPKEDKYLFYDFDTLERVLYQKSIYPNAKFTIIKGVEIDSKGHEIIEDKTRIKCKYTASTRNPPKDCPKLDNKTEEA